MADIPTQKTPAMFGVCIAQCDVPHHKSEKHMHGLIFSVDCAAGGATARQYRGVGDDHKSHKNMA